MAPVLRFPICLYYWYISGCMCSMPRVLPVILTYLRYASSTSHAKGLTLPLAVSRNSWFVFSAAAAIFATQHLFRPAADRLGHRALILQRPR